MSPTISCKCGEKPKLYTLQTLDNVVVCSMICASCQEIGPLARTEKNATKWWNLQRYGIFDEFDIDFRYV